MTIKEMRESLDMTQEMFSRRYNIPRRTIQNWETGKRNPPPYVIEMLQNAIRHYVPHSTEEVMSLPLTVVDLKYMCDDLIRKGYGEKNRPSQQRYGRDRISWNVLRIWSGR